MKIAIDVSQAIYGTGVSVYTKNLVSNLLKIDKENQYKLFGGSFRRRGDLFAFSKKLDGNFSTHFFSLPPTFLDFLWNRAHIIKIEGLVGDIDVYHSSDWAEAPSNAFKVTTVHDLAPIQFPRLTDKKILEAHKRKLELVLNESDRIIAPSKSTKKDLVKMGADKEIIRVIPEAANKGFKPAKKKEIEDVKKKHKISGGYILAVGTNARKNLHTVVKAYEKVRAGQDLKLVVAGRQEGKIYDDRGIRYVGQVTDKELAILYSGAEVLLYPSLYEGFGLPVIEAFSCGCPVVTSNTSSMPEVAGGAAVLVNPYSLSSVVEGLEKALRRKKSLRKKGLERAKDFSWKKTAEMTLDVYKEAKGESS